MKNNILETSDLLLKKAVFDDWQALYRNIWSHEESTRHMMWKVVTTEEEAKSRMEKCLQAQETSPFHWTVNAIVDFLSNEMLAKKVIFSYRSTNISAKKMLEACGFLYSHDVQRTDKRTGQDYVLEYVTKDLMNTDSAKEIAQTRELYMKDFISEFMDEWEGILPND